VIIPNAVNNSGSEEVESAVNDQSLVTSAVSDDGHRSVDSDEVDDDGNDAEGGNGSGSSEDDEASGTWDVESHKAAAKSDVDHVHRRSANKRPVVQTTRYDPGDSD
jgi:hypothetical protein